MGLGKTLTVIALILTNHWDNRPLAKPELGFTRKPLTARMNPVSGRGKGKVGGVFKPKTSAEALGIGRKSNTAARKLSSTSGLFGKFKCDNVGSDEKDKENKFKFTNKKNN